ncbi:hypothetical protein [Falsiroseomonas sp.]|jgi:hypothetical protein|uniref:hypothetical protein n=1 Tax=Falsiroseomonas sp. TaxID=2870721 RepID=UPI0034A571FE
MTVSFNRPAIHGISDSPLTDAGCPFLKRELLRDNPTHLPDLAFWHRIVRDRAPALYREIIEDLKRVMRRAAP